MSNDRNGKGSHMPKIFILLGIIILMFTSCEEEKETFDGYIPMGEEIKINWHVSASGHDLDQTILVITPSGDSVQAHVAHEHFFGSFLVLYRSSYPGAVNKKVYVQGEFLDGVPYISFAEAQ